MGSMEHANASKWRKPLSPTSASALNAGWAVVIPAQSPNFLSSIGPRSDDRTLCSASNPGSGVLLALRLTAWFSFIDFGDTGTVNCLRHPTEFEPMFDRVVSGARRVAGEAHFARHNLGRDRRAQRREHQQITCKRR